MPCHNFSFGPITKVEALEEMGPIAKSRCKMKKSIHSCDNEVKIQDEKNIHSCVITKSRYKMKKTYTHVKLQSPWNQGKASLELI